MLARLKAIYQAEPVVCNTVAAIVLVSVCNALGISITQDQATADVLYAVGLLGLGAVSRRQVSPSR